MDVPEIEQMAKLERDHWWYRGLRGAIRQVLRTPSLRVPPEAYVLDAGCGTGENLRFLQQELSPAYLGGFDLSPRAVEWARCKVGESVDVYVSDIRSPELHVPEFDLMLSCDVISIPGIEQSREGLKHLIDHLRPDGLFIHNMAAYQWLFSSHDVVTHTQDRTTARQMRQLFDDLGLTIELNTYRVCSLFPVIVLRRIPSIIRLPAHIVAHSDLNTVPSKVNSTLASIMKVENWAMGKGVRFPWGSSVFTVGRKRRAA